MGISSPPTATKQARTPLVEVFVAEGLDARAAARLHALLAETLALRPERLVIDLAGCPFIDAVAVQVLLDVHRRVWQVGGGLVLRSPTPRVRRILELARVDHVFQVTHELSAQPRPDRRRLLPSRTHSPYADPRYAEQRYTALAYPEPPRAG